MPENSKPRRNFSREFKLRITDKAAKGAIISELADRHGINPSVIYRWAEERRAGGDAALQASKNRKRGQGGETTNSALRRTASTMLKQHTLVGHQLAKLLKLISQAKKA